MQLVLIRHGQTAWNIGQRAQGQTDIPLDETGLRQAEALVEGLKPLPIQRIWCSDLQRAVQTIQPFANFRGLKIQTRTDLRERSYGDFEGSDYRTIYERMRALMPDHEPHEWTAPNGESRIDVWERLNPVVREINRTEENIAVVTHGGTGSILLARLLHASVITSANFRLRNGSLTVLKRRFDGTYQLVDYSDVHHIPAEFRTQ